MATTTPTLQSAAADALVQHLPTTGILVPSMLPSGVSAASRASSALMASFVGEHAADLALVLLDAQSLQEAAGSDTVVSSGDVVRPALDAAAEVLGSGVLGDVSESDASALFSDRTSTVFELTADGVAVGWFAIRIREGGAVVGATRKSSEEVVGKLGRINNVEMALTVEIGRTRMSVRDVLGLEPGAVIELDRSAGAPADILLNGRLIAHGEIVVIDQDYAVRITTILDVADGLS
ncbi:flagellar motor switch protein FliN [Salinibacterium sp. dk2585]|uniref:flagellar motor switch protein FliN n=1 Tax=unclassified Salinibacterium TaxID=2632331 RepID=UPI0011C24BC2|nr:MULTISPECIES: flagellar motor switch protein FliN [unclassified Salinibacterium]QEE60194.1 flagellar motor switch protein FliN [Salinibacterium sp. dk2585]TXK55266.1 flagellar motor switch protein FliN [Salinibacterium sp. dk5596]